MEKMNQHKRLAGAGRVPGASTTKQHFADGGCAVGKAGKSTKKPFANGGGAHHPKGVGHHHPHSHHVARGKSTKQPW